MTSFEVSTRISASPEQIWPIMVDHERMVDWSPLRRVTLAREGQPDRNGVGAVRHMHGAGPTIVEEVVLFEAPTRMEYVLTKGAPIRDHRGSLELFEAGDVTEVRWSVRFRPVVPGTGWMLKAVLQRALGGMLKRLKENIEGQ